MTVDSKTLHHLCNLARLAPNTNTQEELVSSLQNVLTWIETMQSVNTTGVIPLTHPGDPQLSPREDIVLQSLSIEHLEQNAPDFQDQLFRVPKIIE